MGLGNMGNRWLKFTECRFEVAVHNRTKEKESQSISSSANSLQELMENCDVVLTMLSMMPAKEVLKAHQGFK
jgi:3-hydroxyisobutyrate dehydrogenase